MNKVKEREVGFSDLLLSRVRCQSLAFAFPLTLALTPYTANLTSKKLSILPNQYV